MAKISHLTKATLASLILGVNAYAMDSLSQLEQVELQARFTIQLVVLFVEL